MKKQKYKPIIFYKYKNKLMFKRIVFINKKEVKK